MHILCGTDIIEIERIKKSIERNGENFLNLIYTEAEIAYCESKKMPNTAIMLVDLQQRKQSTKQFQLYCQKGLEYLGRTHKL